MRMRKGMSMRVREGGRGLKRTSLMTHAYVTGLLRSPITTAPKRSSLKRFIASSPFVAVRYGRPVFFTHVS